MMSLIQERPLVWGLFLFYLALTSGLAWIGHKKTTDLASFAVGKGDMSPVVVGITLAASIASTATFVINPGFVYVHGMSALIHLGVAAGAGVIIGLVVMSTGFRRLGAKTGALTLPGWLGERYGSRAMRIAFAAINLLSLSFVVLIIGGVSIVMQATLGLTNLQSLVLTVGFVFSYIFIGGTYAHAYTNTLQGIIMVLVAVVIVASGLPLLGGGAFDKLAAIDPNLVTTVNPRSPLFGSFFDVWVSGFVIGFALVCQPHIMTKALYVKTDRAVRRYLGVTIVVSLCFSALLLVGLYAHLADIPREAFVDPISGAFRQDRVMTVYIAKSFGPVPLAMITVALLAAGMSTLDGILVALSSIAGSDLYLALAEKRLAGKSDEEKARAGHRASQLVLIAMGAAAFVIALDPPKLLGIFGQLGVYGIVAASTVPIAYGIAFPKLGARAAGAAAFTGLAVHFGAYFLGSVANPGVTATYGLLASAAIALPAALKSRARDAHGAAGAVASVATLP